MRFLHENLGQWARNMTVRAYFHSVRLWRVHFVAMNSGAVNSNEKDGDMPNLH